MNGATARHGRSARQWLTVALAPGILTAVASVTVLHPLAAALLGWEVAAAVYLSHIWLHLLRYDAAATARHATIEDPGRAQSDVLLTVASIASLGAVLAIMADSGQHAAELAIVVAGLVLSWLMIHSIFMLRYARLYYAGPHGGIDFNEATPPRYSDFAYLAFTIGMTFQVSDTSLTTARIRRTALVHALFSYFFGAIILASAINLIVNLRH